MICVVPKNEMTILIFLRTSYLYSFLQTNMFRYGDPADSDEERENDREKEREKKDRDGKSK